jgi:hypothetical protein
MRAVEIRSFRGYFFTREWSKFCWVRFERFHPSFNLPATGHSPITSVAVARLFKSCPQDHWLFLMVAMWALIATVARAQDPFEIQVYYYETVPKGRWNLETHINYVGKGTKFFEGPVAPTNNQFHLTFELTRGITNHYETAVYLLTAHRPGAGYEFAGWRLRPRVRLPKSWGLPVDVSFSAEFGFPQRQFDENSVTLELRPIIEK